MDKVKELKEALNGSDVDEIKKLKDELQEKTMSLATKVYEEAAKANQANQANQESETSDSNDSKDKHDNVQEASYEEK